MQTKLIFSVTTKGHISCMYSFVQKQYPQYFSGTPLLTKFEPLIIISWLHPCSLQSYFTALTFHLDLSLDLDLKVTCNKSFLWFTNDAWYFKNEQIFQCKLCTTLFVVLGGINIIVEYLVSVIKMQCTIDFIYSFFSVMLL